LTFTPIVEIIKKENNWEQAKKAATAPQKKEITAEILSLMIRFRPLSMKHYIP
jgi:hypothetical protein